MKFRSTKALRIALTGVAAACVGLWSVEASALGLGRLTVLSALGEPLRAEIDVTAMSAEEAGSLNLRVASPTAYKAAGVEYNAALTVAQVQVLRRPDGRAMLRVTSDRAVLEPFVELIIEATWSSGRLVREYTMLLDPPGLRAPAPAPAPGPSVSPVFTPPAPAEPQAAPAPQPGPSMAPPLPPETSPMPSGATSGTRQAPRAAAPAGTQVDEYQVRRGDTLSRIAGRVRPGVSLDQMLVSLFRANPKAFMGDNMNRLRAGAVLSVPNAEAAAQVTPQEAREVIQAQSADFAAYRQRLAGATTATPESVPARQATGRVQAQVDDRRLAAASSPDKLRLTQGGVKAGAVESRASKEAERQAAATRASELSRNVRDLRELQRAASAAVQVAAAPAANPPAVAPPSPAPAPAPAPTPAASPPPPAPEPAPAAASAATTPGVTVPMPAPVVPPPTASAAEPASAAEAASTPGVEPPPPQVAAASAPVPAPKPRPDSEPSFLDSLMDNAMLLPGAGVLVALLAGVGLYRLRSRSRKSGNETSFLESRLQPDSFFGASGGQRIDTREASSTTSSSSMSYSLSQLDAIGDVDPVAEADVYLAYGRDLQAEEILKEAMRATPDRMAIRTKLLEVYAKRRDAKGFELLATQMHNLTGGKGEDWAKAQVLGQSIDPDNPLYQPGGEPEAVMGASGHPVEALGASTMPYTAPVAPPVFQPAADATLEDSSSGIDLDLDIHAAPPPGSPESTHPVMTGASLSGPTGVDFSLDTGAGKLDNPDSGIDFDVSGFTLDVPSSTVVVPKPASAVAASNNAMTMALPSIAGGGGGDPLMRKLELAEEFRQIGDLEGARDLLEEVLGKADGALRSKAQAMLDGLS